MQTVELYKPFCTVVVKGAVKVKQRRDIHTTTPKVLVTDVKVTNQPKGLDLEEVRDHFWIHLPTKLLKTLNERKQSQPIEIAVKAYYYKGVDGSIKLGFKHPKKPSKAI